MYFHKYDCIKNSTNDSLTLITNYYFCVMKEKEEEMVQCCSNLCGSSWFHPSCVGLEEIPRHDDWFCSEECSEDGAYVYCFCHKQIGGTMAQCELMDKCKRYEWYHLDCLTPEAQEESKGR